MNRIIALGWVLLFTNTLALQAGDGKTQVDPSAARLWEQTCSRCHNLRPAKSFSDAQWEVIVHHMRTRANLTRKQTDTVTRYLKEAN